MLFITGEKIFTKLKKKKCGTLKILVHNSSVQRTDHLKDCRHGLPLKAASFLYYRKTRLQKRKGRRRRVNLHYGCVSKKKKKVLLNALVFILYRTYKRLSSRRFAVRSSPPSRGLDFGRAHINIVNLARYPWWLKLAFSREFFNIF